MKYELSSIETSYLRLSLIGFSALIAIMAVAQEIMPFTATAPDSLPPKLREQWAPLGLPRLVGPSAMSPE